MTGGGIRNVSNVMIPVLWTGESELGTDKIQSGILVHEFDIGLYGWFFKRSETTYSQ